VSERKYFAASNTEAGFVSYFAENFRKRADRSYIIKGGPGTGKSRLMREMGEAWEGAGGDVEYYYCSSDPASLDGLYVVAGGERIAVMDGTAPHSEDIVNAGIVDNIIDLGRFWDAKILRQRRRDIETFGAEKKRAYTAAYRALASYGSALRAADALAESCIDKAAIEDEAAKIAVNLKKEKMLLSPISAVGMRGYVSFDSFRESAGLTLSVSDTRGYGLSYLYFDALVRAVGSCRIAPHPILTGRYSGLLSGSVAVVEATLTDRGEKVIDISDFVDRSLYLPIKERVEKLRLAADTMLEEAMTSFKEAGAAHMKIEEIFATAMDFVEKEAYSGYLCSKIASGDL
jgi:hypothetical protein